MRKRVLSTLLVLCMMLTLTPWEAWAESTDSSDEPVVLQTDEEQELAEQGNPVKLSEAVASGSCGANLTWALSNDGTLIISGTGAMSGFKNANGQYSPPWSDYKSTIRKTIIENGVTSVGAGAFYKCTELNSITIPDSVTSIGEYAFFQCAIRDIDLPVSVKSIGAFAFDACEYLESITIPAGITRIEDATFWSCYALSEVVLPDSITYISGRAFSSCRSLASLYIPSNVTELGGFVFEGCKNLSRIYIPASITSIGSYAFDGCSQLANVYYFGSETQWEQVTKGSNNEHLLDATIHYNYIAGSVASGSCGDNLTWALDQAGVLSISGTGAMYDYLYTNDPSLNTQPWRDYLPAVRTIRIGDGVTIIGHYAFAGCSNLTSVTIPDNVTLIRSYAFYGCSSLSRLTIPGSHTSIGNESTTGGFGGYSVFEGCISLTSAGPIGGGYDYEFGWTDSIPDGAFWGCSGLTSVTIPDSVTKIGYMAFDGCRSLTSVTIPDGVTSIGHHAFRNCTGLSSVTIPDSVTCIDGYVDGAFEGCTNLTSAGPIGGGYDYEFGWTDSIPDLAFCGCSGLTSVTIPDSVTSIGYMAFNGCRSLANVTIPDGVTTIGSEAFWNCTGLSNVVIPDDVTVIGQAAFRGCSGLTSVTIPNGVPSIGNYVFEGCTGLTSATISNGPTSIGYNTFSDCTALTYVIIPKSVTNISSDAFKNCNSITDIYFGGSESEWAAIRVEENNEILEKAEIHYNSDDPSQLETKTISGILRSSDAGDIRWKCRYQIGNDGIPCNGRIDITMNSSSQTGELYLYNESDAAGFPWELPPYNIPKSAITKVVITGPLAGPRFRITANSFQGYDKLQTLVLDRVSGIDSYAFESCTSLKSVLRGTTDDILKYLGNGAFKNCTKLAEMNFSGITTIGDETFRNTALRTITLGTSVTEIGTSAFSGCANVKIRCHENSTAHKYAQDNKIPFELIDDTLLEKTFIPYYSQAGNISTDLDIDWGWDLFDLPTTIYNNRLATLGLVLSAATESSCSRAESLLIDCLGFDKKDSRSYDANGVFSPAVTFGYKKVVDGSSQAKHIFVVAIRGTSHFGDGVTDALALVNGLGFTVSTEHVAFDFGNFIKGCGVTSDEIKNEGKIFVTGHSLGGAIANLLAAKLNDEYGTANVFGYTFASPLTAPSTTVVGAIPSIWNLLNGQNKNIHNITHGHDPVTMVGSLGAFTRYGQNYPSFYMDDPSNINLLDNYRMLRGVNYDYSPDGFWKPHLCDVYMAYFLSSPTVRPIQLTNGLRIIHVACPVDVEVFTSNQQMVGRIIDNQPSKTVPGKTYIYIEDDEKYIILADDDDYSIKITSTGVGTMQYSVHEIDVSTGETIAEKAFENVVLTTGKQFTSDVSVWDKTDSTVDTANKIDTPEVQLIVLDIAGTPEKEVLPDGKGTEVPLDAIVITFDANGGSVTTAAMVAEAEGKLSSLPTPTRSNYTFDGWFTAASGGDIITTETVFNCNTTVYAHWTRSSGSGNSGGSSGGSSFSATHAVEIPSVANGTITVNPKSASKGSTVTINAVPDVGYQLISLTVSDSSGKAITLVDKGNGKYTFTMPSNRVTVDAVFKPVQNSETTWTNPFSDVSESAWYYGAVRFVQENGIMNGYGDKTFAPNANLSRAMLAQILYNKEGHPVVSGISVFSDVTPNAWYSDAVSWAAERGIVSGYGKGLFGPDDDITREQLAVMLWRYAGEPAATNKELQFSDADNASDYALDALRWAVESGIINGKGNGILDPKEPATRAQVAQMLMNYLKK